MKNLKSNTEKNIFESPHKKVFQSTLGLIVLILSISFSSCQEDPPACEMQNTGTFVIENGHPNGSLEVYFNKGKVPINGLGDLSLEPGEKGNMELSVGNHNIKAILVITDCSGDRCMVSSSSQNDSDEELRQCEIRNFVF